MAKRNNLKLVKQFIDECNQKLDVLQEKFNLTHKMKFDLGCWYYKDEFRRFEEDDKLIEDFNNGKISREKTVYGIWSIEKEDADNEDMSSWFEEWEGDYHATLNIISFIETFDVYSKSRQ